MKISVRNRVATTTKHYPLTRAFLNKHNKFCAGNQKLTRSIY